MYAQNLMYKVTSTMMTLHHNTDKKCQVKNFDAHGQGSRNTVPPNRGLIFDGHNYIITIMYIIILSLLAICIIAISIGVV